MKSNKNIYYLILACITFFNCVEVFDIKSLTYENFLVVEATITNEFKQHEIKLSRTFEIDSLGPRAESNANVYIIDETQNIFNFTETTTGVYTSDNSFAAAKDKEYTLKIETSAGETYTSSTQQLTTITSINAINYTVENNAIDEEIINISVNSYNAANDANYYRYEYEETYKIIAPYFSNFTLEIISDVPPFNVDVISKNNAVNECFNTLYSDDIIQTETASLSEDNVVNFSVREISTTNFIITNRYSILIKQYVQNATAYNYYNTLNNFSSNDSYFSQIQAGFLQGNLSSETNTDEKVIGFFEVSSVSEKRIFFNRSDIGDLIPNYVDTCEFISPLLSDPFTPNTSPLISALNNDYVFFDDNTLNDESLEGPYLLVKTICGDCTKLGTAEKPSFWID